MSGGGLSTSGVRAATSGVAHHAPPVWARIISAWERFAAGEDVSSEVRPHILASWYRCRDDHGVNPQLTHAPAAAGGNEHPLDHDVVIAELGGLAVSAAKDIPVEEGIVTVTDSAGRVLACWGDDQIRHQAADGNLAPWAGWSERCIGTNGMGTALEAGEPVTVLGPEHWCAGFHEWTCAGVAIRDVVTGSAMASVNISRWRAPLPAQVSAWLRRVANSMHADLRGRAVRDGAELAAVFNAERPRSGHPLAAVDCAGRGVVADDAASAVLGLPADRTMIDPRDRAPAAFPALATVVRWARHRAQADADWTGSAQLGSAVAVTLRPVFGKGRLLGMLCECNREDGEPYRDTAEPRQRPLRRQVIGVRGDRSVLLTPSEIRFAEADRNTVWLITDRGRMRSAIRGLDNVATALAGLGFVRVHRSFVVNLRRVREVERGFKNDLILVTDPQGPELVPVARRHLAEVRGLLGV
ncbi:MAG: DNA-binding protein [Actinophytocola sp.]|nr:DNA-binding protein [Actinophytocola sp.]